MNKEGYKSRSDRYQSKQYKSFKNTLMFKLIGLVISVTLFVLFFCMSFAFNQITDTLEYTQLGNADYSVKLLPNDEYGEIVMTSGNNKAFVSSIIDQIKPQFNYELHGDKNLTIRYKYTISSTLYYINYSDGKELKRDYQVIDEGESIESTRDFYLRKSIDVDFQKYQESIKQYKQLFQIPVRSKLVVTMNVYVLGFADSYSDTLSKSITQEITIPVGELTTDVTITSPSLNDTGKIYRVEKISIKNMFFALLDVIFFMGVVHFTILVIKKCIMLSNKKDIYNITLNKILSNYDSVIVSGKMKINEDNYDNIIYPDKFEEMVDASVNENSPILYYEIIRNELAVFIIAKDNTLYKYEVSRDVLEGE